MNAYILFLDLIKYLNPSLLLKIFKVLQFLFSEKIFKSIYLFNKEK